MILVLSSSVSGVLVVTLFFNKSIQKQLEKKDKELPKQTSKNLDNKKNHSNRKKKSKFKRKIISQDQIEKSLHRQSSRLPNQPRKVYKTFNTQSKILKKVEF